MNAPSVDTDGTVYFCSISASNAPGPLYAIDGTTGIEKWKYEFGGGVRVEYCSPVISNDYIVIGNRGTNGSIVVINKADGT